MRSESESDSDTALALRHWPPPRRPCQADSGPLSFKFTGDSESVESESDSDASPSDWPGNLKPLSLSSLRLSVT